MENLTYKLYILYLMCGRFRTIKTLIFGSRQAVNQFNWQRVFLNTIVTEKVDIFNDTILNILSNFILHKVIIYDDKDPPWLNKKKGLIHEKKCSI